jgi:hypothetical protein
MAHYKKYNSPANIEREITSLNKRFAYVIRPLWGQPNTQSQLKSFQEDYSYLINEMKYVHTKGVDKLVRKIYDFIDETQNVISGGVQE